MALCRIRVGEGLVVRVGMGWKIREKMNEKNQV